MTEEESFQELFEGLSDTEDSNSVSEITFQLPTNDFGLTQWIEFYGKFILEKSGRMPNDVLFISDMANLYEDLEKRLGHMVGAGGTNVVAMYLTLLAYNISSDWLDRVIMYEAVWSFHKVIYTSFPVVNNPSCQCSKCLLLKEVSLLIRKLLLPRLGEREVKSLRISFPEDVDLATRFLQLFRQKQGFA